MHYHPHAPDFVFFGMRSGAIRCLQLLPSCSSSSSASGPPPGTAPELRLSSYGISARMDLGVRPSGAVVELCVHPRDPNLLLIAHARGSLLEWNMGKRTVERRYVPVNPHAQASSLCCACYAPEGKEIMAGYQDGSLCVWERRRGQEVRPTQLLTLSPYTDEKRPVRKLVWTRFEQQSLLISHGGTSVAQEPDGLLVRYGEEVTFLNPPMTLDNDISALISDFNSSFIAFATASPDPYERLDPTAIVCVTDDGQLCAFAAGSGGVFPPLVPPTHLLLHSSPISCSLYCMAPAEFVHDLRHIFKDRVPRIKFWPVCGGRVREPDTATPRSVPILITGHESGAIYLWDMSSYHVELLYALYVTEQYPIPATPTISAVHLCESSRVLAVSCLSGEAFVYFFNSTERRILKQEYKQSKSIEVQKPSAYRVVGKKESESRAQPAPPSGPPPKEAAAAVQAKAQVAPTISEFVVVDRPSPPPGRPPAHAVAVTPFSWERFFLDAGIAASEASKYASSFEKEDITEDLIDEMDNDMMELAGVATVGDRLRIKKQVKRYQQQKQERMGRNGDQQPLVSEAEATPPKPLAGSVAASKPLQRASSMQSSTVESIKAAEPVRPSTAPLGSSATAPGTPPQEQEPLPMHPPGFQLNVECNFTASVTCIQVASGLQKVAFGDSEGNIALFDLITGRCLLFRSLLDDAAPSSVENSSDSIEEAMTERRVMWMMFDSEAITKATVLVKKRKILKKSKLKSKEMAVLEAGLFVALANGRMFHVNLKNGQIEPVRLTSLEVSPAHVPSLNVLLLLDSNGKLVKPPAGEWHDLTHDDAADDEHEEEVAPPSASVSEDGELVVTNLDAEQPSIHSRGGGKALLPHKYLIVCTNKGVSVYSVPAYTLLFHHNMASPPLGAHVASHDGESCLVILDMDGGLHVLGLLDLLPLWEKPYALTEYSLSICMDRMQDCFKMLDDGRVVFITLSREVVRASLFAHENKLNLPYCVPKIHNPRIQMPELSKGFFGGIFSSLPDFESLLGKPAIPKSRQDVQKREEEANRDALFGEIAKHEPEPVQRTTPEDTEHVRRSATASEVHDIMRENIRKLKERGEKFKEIEEDSAKMADSAARMRQQAQQVAEAQEKKSWWQAWS